MSSSTAPKNDTMTSPSASNPITTSSAKISDIVDQPSTNPPPAVNASAPAAENETQPAAATSIPQPTAPSASPTAPTTQTPQAPQVLPPIQAPQEAVKPTPNPKKRRAPEPSPQDAAATAASAMSVHAGQAAGASIVTPVPSAISPPPPPAKKGRTNTPWTPAEEQRLKMMRDAGNSWSEIAKTFPTRTEGSVKKHWYKDMHYAEFAEDESAALLAAIKEYDSNKWKVIGQKVGKPAKACEQYAREHFGTGK